MIKICFIDKTKSDVFHIVIDYQNYHFTTII